MSGQTERALTARAIEPRVHRRAIPHHGYPTSADGVTLLQQKDSIIHRQETKLAQYVAVSKKIIQEFLGPQGETVEYVSPSELLKVIDYVKLMKSSVEIFQTINAALKERIDELLHVSEQDGQILQSVLAYVQSLPVLHAARDARTSEVNFQIDFHSGQQTIQIPASETVMSHQEGRLGRRRKVNWFKNVLSVAAFVAIGTSVAKSGLGKCNRNA